MSSERALGASDHDRTCAEAWQHVRKLLEQQAIEIRNIQLNLDVIRAHWQDLGREVGSLREHCRTHDCQPIELKTQPITDFDTSDVT